MQAFGEPPQQRLIRIGRIAFDDQLTPGDAKGDERAIGQQRLGTPGDRLDGRLERRVPARVHRVLVQRDRELDEELAQLARERRPVAFGLDAAQSFDSLA